MSNCQTNRQPEDNYERANAFLSHVGPEAKRDNLPVHNETHVRELEAMLNEAEARGRGDVKELVEYATMDNNFYHLSVCMKANVGKCTAGCERVRAILVKFKGVESVEQQTGGGKRACLTCIISALHTNSPVAPVVATVIPMGVAVQKPSNSCDTNSMEPSMELWRCSRCSSVYAWPAEKESE